MLSVVVCKNDKTFCALIKDGTRSFFDGDFGQRPAGSCFWAQGAVALASSAGGTERRIQGGGDPGGVGAVMGDKFTKGQGMWLLVPWVLSPLN